MTTKQLITDMDRFFAEQWQKLADDMERDGSNAAYPDDYEAAKAKADIYQNRIIGMRVTAGAVALEEQKEKTK